MAPEQARGRAREIDARADVWGAGATLFAILTGHVVHEAPSVAEMIFLCATQPAPPIATWLPETPPAIGQVVDRALAFRAADRWESAGAMRSALHCARDACPLAPTPLPGRFRASVTLPEDGSVRRAVTRNLSDACAQRAFTVSSQPRVLSNAYVLERVLGEGGTGIVYQARSRLTRETVALKQLRPRQGLPERDADQRLVLAREFQTMASLHHPNIVRVFDYGFDDTWGPYFTMEMLAAPRDILSATRDRSIEAKVAAWVELLRALAYLEVAEHQREAARVAPLLGKRCVLYDWFAAADAEQASNEGRRHDAIRLARATIDLARATNGVYAEGLGFRVWARALAALGPENAKEADGRFAESLRIHEAAGATATVTQTRIMWAESCRRRGDMAASRRLLRCAAENEEAFAVMASAPPCALAPVRAGARGSGSSAKSRDQLQAKTKPRM